VAGRVGTAGSPLQAVSVRNRRALATASKLRDAPYLPRDTGRYSTEILAPAILSRTQRLDAVGFHFALFSGKLRPRGCIEKGEA
jgi:hypothetical protein